MAVVDCPDLIDGAGRYPDQVALAGDPDLGEIAVGGDDVPGAGWQVEVGCGVQIRRIVGDRTVRHTAHYRVGGQLVQAGRLSAQRYRHHRRNPRRYRR